MILLQIDVEVSDALTYMVQNYYQGAGIVQESLDQFQQAFRCCGIFLLPIICCLGFLATLFKFLEFIDESAFNVTSKLMSRDFHMYILLSFFEFQYLGYGKQLDLDCFPRRL